MSWKMLGKPISTADNASVIPTISQKFRRITPYPNAILDGFVAGFILYNSPVFTGIDLELWSEQNGYPGRLIATSIKTYVKSELLLSQNHAFKSMGFTMPRMFLKSGSWYFVAARLSGYTGDSSKFVAWKNSYPNPPHIFNSPVTKEKAANCPLDLSVIAADQESDYV